MGINPTPWRKSLALPQTALAPLALSGGNYQRMKLKPCHSLFSFYQEFKNDSVAPVFVIEYP